MTDLAASSEHVRIPGITIDAHRVGFGTYHLLEKINASEALDAFGAAFEAGINLIDTSDNYGTELAIGRAVSAGILPRDEVIIATKTGLGTTLHEQRAWTQQGRRYNTSPDRIRRQVENSLRVLGDDVGYIDLYQLHVHDPEIEPIEHAEVMAELMETGTIRAWGVSNYDNADLNKLLVTCDRHGIPRPATSQPYCNLLQPTSLEEVDFASQEGLVVLAHSPLLKGVLTENGVSAVISDFQARNERGNEHELRVMEAVAGQLQGLVELSVVARAEGRSLAQVALAWVLQNTGVVALTAPTNPNYLTDAIDAANLKLSKNMEAAITSLHSDLDSLQILHSVLHEIIRPIKGY